MLLIIENNKNFCQYFDCHYRFLDTSALALVDTLNELAAFEGIKQIYIPVELKFADTYRQSLQGLELFKHLRLTPDLGYLQFLPVLLGYTYPLERLLGNSENTILCSPGTNLFHLKNIRYQSHQISDQIKPVPKQALKPFVFLTATDLEASEHDIRNQYGPEKLKKELNKASNGIIEFELWQKKIYFLQSELNNTDSLSEKEYKEAIKGKRILYLDDEGDKWKDALTKLYAGATLDVQTDFLNIENFLDELQLKQNELLDKFTEIDSQLIQIFSTKGRNHEFIFKYNEALVIKKQLADLINYDLILLDMRLDKENDRNKPIEDLSGIKILERLEQLNPFVPVIMFTASTKIESYKRVIRSGAYDFWIKNVSTAQELKVKSFHFLKNVIPKVRGNDIKELYAKLLMIENRVGIYNYEIPKTKQIIEPNIIPENLRIRINKSIWFFLNYLQRFVTDEVSDTDIEELWKQTGDTLQIRVPAIYQRTEGEVKRIDSNKVISAKEFDFRWYRNYYQHNQVDDVRRNQNLNPRDKNATLDYINHTINFLLDYR